MTRRALMLLLVLLGSGCATVERAQSGPILVELHPSWESANDACGKYGSSIPARGCAVRLGAKVLLIIVPFAEDIAHEACHLYFFVGADGDPLHRVCRP